jgi:hypothetical protein
MFKNCLILILAVSALVYIKTEVVCSEDELVREILEDLEDNGKKIKIN